jgi:hypothetical protein
MVIFALPVLSSPANRLARLLASMVPPIPPPTINIFIALLLSFLRYVL